MRAGRAEPGRRPDRMAMRTLRAAFGREARPSRGTSVAAVLSGAALALGLAPWEAWWIALPALIAVTALVAAAPSAGPRIWTGWWAGTGFFAAAMFWIVEPFFVDPVRHGWMAPFAIVFMAGGLALFWALAALVSGLGRGYAARAAGFALGLALADLARSYVLTGFPWALAGHVWIGTPVAQAAAVLGPIGLSLLTAAAAALPVALGGGRFGLRACAAVLASAALVGGAWAWGAVRLAAPEPAPQHEIRVRLVQPNAAQHLKWQGDMWSVFLGRQIDQTAAPASPAPDLVVWPETAVPFLLDDAGDFLTGAASVAQGAQLALGIQRAEGLRYYNSLVVIGPDGARRALYDKARLTPFGEYVPLGDLAARFGIRAFAAQAGFGYSAGPGPDVLDLGAAGRVLPIICYEGIFPQYLAAAPVRADWILQITNDGWFGNISGPYQHLALLRLRAIEQGLPVLRSANTGISAVIDAKGRVLESLPLNTDGVIDTLVPAALPPTPYARWGDMPATILIILSVLALGLIRRLRTH